MPKHDAADELEGDAEHWRSVALHADTWEMKGRAIGRMVKARFRARLIREPKD